MLAEGGSTLRARQTNSAGAAAGSGSAFAALEAAGRALQVVLFAQAAQQRKLGFQEVDVLLGVGEDFGEDQARDIVLREFALLDAVDERPAAAGLDVQVGLQALADRLADLQLVQVLQVRQAVEEQDALDELVGVLHLADRLVVGDLAEAAEAPVVVHPRMQEVLVDRGQLVGQRLIQEPD